MPVRADADEIQRLAHTAWGTGPLRMLLHGFTGSAVAMRPLVEGGLAGRIIAPDLIGHGQSPAPAGAECYQAEAQHRQLADLITTPIDLIGYSMGARLALSFAVAHPERVRRLVLLSGRAGMADPQARAQRIRADEALADRIESDGIPTFAQRWGALPIFATQRPATRAHQHAVRLKQRALGLANSLRGFGAGAMPPLHTHLPTLSMPVCLVAGGLDAKFVQLTHQMAQHIPRATVHLIDGIGHAVHLEAPDTVAAIINDFLSD